MSDRPTNLLRPLELLLHAVTHLLKLRCETLHLLDRLGDLLADLAIAGFEESIVQDSLSIDFTVELVTQNCLEPEAESTELEMIPCSTCAVSFNWSRTWLVSCRDATVCREDSLN